MMKKYIKILLAACLLTSFSVQAVPWCHKGTIVQIADVTWSQSHILANFLGTVPSTVTDPEQYITFTATHNYANTYAGGGGGFGGYSVPGSGQVIVEPYAPVYYTSYVGPGYYFTSQGVKFKLKKCYTIPPMVHYVDFDVLLKPDDNGPGIIDVKPYKKIKKIRKFWKIVDPDDDEDYDQDEDR